MRLTEAIGKATGLLAFGGVDRTGRDARRLLAHALGVPHDRLALEVHRDLSEAEWEAFHTLLTRRLEHEPVSRIIGRRAFWGRDFKISPHVLDPRPETETLIAEVLSGPAAARVLDLGTGSGILAVTLAAEWPAAQVMATDISPEALDVALGNAQAHGVVDRVRFVESDWFQAVPGRFDLILSNPPYIAAHEMPGLDPEVREHDPRHALTDEADGLSAYRRIAAGAAEHLAPGGRLIVEIGPTQAAPVAELFRAGGLESVTVHLDLDGRARAVQGRLAASG